MNLYKYKSILGLFLICLGNCAPIFGQNEAAQRLRQQLEKYSYQTVQEKLFVHTDRSFYLTGETMWFKLYNVDGTTHQAIDLSKVAYLELIDKDQKPVLQSKIILEKGKGKGSVFLPVTLNSGHYLVRAYTHWMKNFGPETYFEKAITLVNPFKKLGLKPVKDSLSHDIQFFPEGGHLVQGIQSTVAFKAVDKLGKGITFKGTILNQNNDTVASFRPLQLGMGHFSFTPQPNQVYRALIKDATGKVMTRPLPKVEAQGYVMHVENTGSQLKVTVNAQLTSSGQNSSENPVIYLAAHTRQDIKVADMRMLNQGTASFVVDKKALGEGVSHFTIFNDNRQPVCERLFFKKPTQQVLIDAQTDQSQYPTRKKVNVDLLAHDFTGKPAMADMSVSVYQIDSLQPVDPSDIASYLWLTSELKGAIESPEYYFKNSGIEVEEAIDNLVLTQGWRRFGWERLGQKTAPAFEFIADYVGHHKPGKVGQSQTGAPAADVTVYFSAPGKPIALAGARSNAKGLVQFEMKDFYGAKDIILQTNNQRDSTYKLELLNPFSEQSSGLRLPEFDLSQSFKDQILSRSVDMQAQNAYFQEKNNRFRLPKIDSVPFYGEASEKYMLETYTRFIVMEEVLREYVPGVAVRIRKGGFHLMVLDEPHRLFFPESPLILMDGIPVFDINKFMAFSPLKIKTLDVVTNRYVLGPLVFEGIINCTTYKGDLAGYPLDPRALVLEYEGLQLQREFYAPRYDTPQQTQSRLPDFRNLLYWSPDAQTNDQGKHSFDFYTSDQEGKYAVVVQGITAGGQAASKTVTIEVKRTL
jgi:hypothetical protein